MFIEFFDIEGVVHHEFSPPGQTVNGHFYVQVLQRLRVALRRKRRDKWQGEWCLHHDNAPSHTSLVVQQFLAEESLPVITQASYPPDLAPRDFWLFPTLKMGLKGRISQPWRTSNRMRRPNSGRFQKKPSAGASNSGSIDRASLCVRKGPTLNVIRYALSYALPLQCYTTFPGTF